MTALLPPDLAVDDEPFSDDDLDRYALGDSLPADAAFVGQWTVTDDGAAEWAMAKYAVLHAERERLLDQAAAYHARIDLWIEEARRPLDRRLEFFRGALEDYARRRREADPRARTLVLPSGRVSSRSVPAKVTVADEAEVLRWARLHLADAEYQAVVRESVRLTDLRRVVRITESDEGTVVRGEDGFPVAGVVVEPEHVSVSVQVTS